jgi:deoxynucleoside triphosphate triphosphohydrolase SAMHD1
MELIQDYKEIYDSVHGFIKVTNLACLIIDTLEFQRLRYLHQLGTCHYVFPCATHTRFEHSIGTYHLASKVIESIKNNTPDTFIDQSLEKIEELKPYYYQNYNHQNKNSKLDPYVTELVKIAGLCHDLGHGPFSHVFDDIFIPHARKDKEVHFLDSHEHRSCHILQKIIHHNEFLKKMIDENAIQFIKNCITPKKDQFGFIYQIISNSLNNVDIDKFDYILRDTKNLGLKYGIDAMRLIQEMKVIDDKICFPEKIYYEVVSVFKSRYRLHKQIYSHKVVICIQYMLNEIMLLMDPIVKIYESTHDINSFQDLTDDYILSTLKFLYSKRYLYSKMEQENIIKAYDIWININKRNLYKFMGTIVSQTQLNIDDDLILNIDPTIKKEEIVIYTSKIGFVSGSKKNPLDELYFYNKKDPTFCFTIKKEHISFLIPSNYQEYIYMFYIKNKFDLVLENKMKILLSRLEN